MSKEPKDTYPDADRAIIEKFNVRDENAIRDVEVRYGSYCHGIAMSILDNREDAEECVNDTWLKAWNSIPPENPTSLKHYLGRLTRHLSIDRFRTLHRRKRNKGMTVLLDELETVTPAEDVTDRLGADLTEFLYTLEPAERNLFIGRYWHAYPPEVLAAEYGITANAVGLRLMRTRNKLRAFLTERGYTV